jgi:hypothetical protein
MTFALRTAFVVFLILILSAGFIPAAESVRITTDISEETAELSVVQHGDNGTSINADVPAIEITTVNLNSKDYSKINLPVTENLFAGEMSEDGKPDLPVLSTWIAVPNEVGISYTVNYTDIDIIEDIDIAPTQLPIPSTGEEIPPFFIDDQAYSKDEFYPGEIAEVKDPVIMRGVRIVQVVLNPVQYNPVTRQAKIYRGLSVDLEYTSDNVVNPKTTNHEYLSDGFYPIYKAMISNFDEMFSTNDVRRGGYLIIVKDAWADSLKNVADWKRRKGYYVHIAPTTELAPGGSPTQTQVKSYIQSAYDNWEVPPEYVMIVGDDDGTYGIPDYPWSGYASDHPYACTEGNDYLPELFIARLSVDYMSQLRVALAKVMDYETDPYMEDPNYWTRGFSAAGNIGATTPRITTLWVRELLLDHGFTEFDTVFSWNTNPDPRMLQSFNNGPCIINYRGWGFTDRLGAPAFTISNLEQVQNHNKIGVMASLTCGTGDFGTYTDCWGEAWIRTGASVNAYKGGPAFYGATDHGTHTKWDNPIMVGYNWGYVRENTYHFAAAAVRGKIQEYITFPRHINGEVQKYFHTFNMLGDPEL